MRRSSPVSSFYESAAAHGAEGPAYLNVAAALRTQLDAESFKRFARDVELAVGRARSTRRLAARPIDIDLLIFDGEVVQAHFEARPYNVAPLAEIAPHAVSAPPGRSDPPARAQVCASIPIVNPKSRRFDSRSAVPASRSVRRVVHFEIDGRARVYNGEFTMVADLASDKAGVHMSRFAEILEEATLDVLARDASRPASNASPKRSRARSCARQRAIRADVRLRAEFGSGTMDAGERQTRRGDLHASRHRACRRRGNAARRRRRGRRDDRMSVRAGDGARALARRSCSTPASARATRSARSTRSRSRPTISAGAARSCSASDENAGRDSRRRPRRDRRKFDVERDVRPPQAARRVLRREQGPPQPEVRRGRRARHPRACARHVSRTSATSTFVFASQVNEESIHKHDAFAEGFGLFGELREELRSGSYVQPKTDLAAWLRTRPSPVLA